MLVAAHGGLPLSPNDRADALLLTRTSSMSAAIQSAILRVMAGHLAPPNDPTKGKTPCYTSGSYYTCGKTGNLHTNGMPI